MQKILLSKSKIRDEKKTKPLLTIGIPTYNRADYCNARLLDLEKMGYLSHPEVQIIIHDNDSTEKKHCQRIRNIQKKVTNLELIESAPNIGMVKGCYKILVAASGTWIALLGDDDPIVMKCSNFLELIKKSKNSNHLYFKTKVHEKGKINEISWFPKLKIGSYNTADLCAKAGFTTHFAFLGSHCFRNKKGIAEIWMKSHAKCMFYGHCVMLLENYRRSCYTGKTVAAWTSGNERISNQLNIWRHLELRNLFKYPPSKAIREFTLQKPWEVVEKGRSPLLDHITHPAVKFVNEYEQLPKNYRITLRKVSTISFNPLNKILILGKKINERANCSCIFINEKFAKKSHSTASIVFHVGPLVSTAEISRIIAMLRLMGPIYLNDSEVSDISLVRGYIHHSRLRRIISDYLLLIYAISLYGAEGLDRRKIIINYFTRPRKGLYAGINAIERALRKMAQKILSQNLTTKLRKLFIVLNTSSGKRCC
jgi:glycosyltransferase involved in cell wall biosynthesis